MNKTFSHHLSKKLLKTWLDIQDKKIKTPKCFVGFDGFTDTIIAVVDQRINKENLKMISSIADFGTRILSASEKSCNFELVTKQTKIGGNAPIFTNALLEGGHQIIFAGAIGAQNEIEPLFLPISSRCKEVYPLAKSAKTDALEFQDGKIILGKLDSLKDISYENLLKQIDLSNLIQIFEETDLFVSANWTMLPCMTEIWRHLSLDIAPKLKVRATPRLMFVDLADPAKRTDKDLLEALNNLSILNKTFDVILGLNVSEAERLAKILQVNYSTITPDFTLALFQKLKIKRLLIHNRSFAVSQDEDDYFYFDSFYTPTPLLTTGAGDNFNAGYCNALLYKLSKEEALILGLGTAGYYVRNGRSPTIPDLASFLDTCN